MGSGCGAGLSLCWGRRREVVAVGGGEAWVARAMGSVEVMVNRIAARPVVGLVIVGNVTPLQMMERRTMAAPRPAPLVPLMSAVGSASEGGVSGGVVEGAWPSVAAACLVVGLGAAGTGVAVVSAGVCASAG